MRIDVISKDFNQDSHLSELILQQTHCQVEALYSGKSYWLQTNKITDELSSYSQSLFRDKVDEALLYQELPMSEIDFDYLIQVTYKPGVTDNTAHSAKQALADNFSTLELDIATGEIHFLKAKITLAQAKEIGNTVLANSLIQRIQVYPKDELSTQIPSPPMPQVVMESHLPATHNLAITDEGLIKLSKDNLWALSLEEMKQIQTYYKSSESIELRKKLSLPADPTDIEMEVLAQTWSEHCKHKIFNANINYEEDPNVKNPLGKFRVESIFKSHIKKATKDVEEKFNIDWLIS
ncbi:MAG: hypothetical protein HON90_16555, partial [Halobacteriovoraceae bacterium]|nr:hypothetical protein [Halobacteriovoraceae bacterium]